MDTSFSIDHVRRLFDLAYDNAAITELKQAKRPAAAGDGLVLVPACPLNLNELIKRFPARFNSEASWVRNSAFAEKKLECRWYAVGLGEYPDSFCRSYQEQVALVASEQGSLYEVAGVTLMVYTALLFAEVRQRPLIQGIKLRCSDTDKVFGKHIAIEPGTGYAGRSGAALINLTRIDDRPRQANVGIAYMIKNGR